MMKEKIEVQVAKDCVQQRDLVISGTRIFAFHITVRRLVIIRQRLTVLLVQWIGASCVLHTGRTTHAEEPKRTSMPHHAFRVLQSSDTNACHS
jgi:hypothetical protein